MIATDQEKLELIKEIEDYRRRVQELEDLELQRISDEQDRFDSLQVLDEYAKQLEESRDKLARLFKAAADIQEAKTVQEALDKIAAAVKAAGWGSVSVALYDQFEIIQSAYAGCTQSDIEFLQTHRRPAAERARMYGQKFDCFKVSRSYFVPAERLSEVLSLENVCPGRREVQPGDDWDPMDLAYVPLYGRDDTVIGSINCDDPLDGHRPSRETIFYLELFAELVSHKVETARLVEQQQRTEEALRQSEELYRKVFNRSGDGFFLLDYLFKDCNDKACELFGCTREEIIDHSPAEFSPEYQSDGRLSTVAAQEFIDQAISHRAQSFNWTHRRKDGSLLDCEVSLSPIRVGDRDLVFAVVRDVTSRVQAERALRRSEERFRNLFEDSPIGMTIVSSEGRYLIVNDSFCKTLGYSESELMGKPFAEITHPEDLAESLDVMHKLTVGQQDSIQHEKRYVHKAGYPIWASVNVSALRDHVSGSVHFVTQVQDISERKRAELERETIIRILKIANEATQPDLMIDRIFSEVERLVPAENRFLALFNSEDELIRFPYFVDEMDAPPPPVPLGRGLTSWVIRNGKPLRLGPADFERLARSGEIELLGSPAFAWLGVPLIANTNVIGALVVQSYKSTSYFDSDHERILAAVAAQIATVIERQQAQAALQHKTDELQAIFQAMPDLYFRVTGDGTILDFQAGQVSDLYVTPENFLGKRFVDVLPTDVGQKITRAIEDVRISGEMVSLEYQVLIGDQTKDFEARVLPLPSQQCILVVRNITESRRVMGALRESEQRFKSLADTVPAMIWLTGIDKKLIFVNQGWLDFSGKKMDEIFATEWGQDIHDEDGRRVVATYQTAFDTRVDFSVQCRMKRKDGEFRWVVMNGRPRFTSTGRFVGYIGTCLDITERLSNGHGME